MVPGPGQGTELPSPAGPETISSGRMRPSRSGGRSQTRMRTLIIGFCASLVPATCTARAADPSPRPNILLVTGDDLGLQLGCYGDRTVTTPHMDRLAREGMRFTN